MADLPDDHVHPDTRADWRAWLEANHARDTGVWVVTYRKAAGRATPSYDDLVEEALCFGWVDSKPGKLDEMRTRLYFAPRKARSGWARPNKVRVEKLLAAGKIHPSGMAKIAAAQADGSWEALDDVENLVVPDDLAAALAANPPARANWDGFPRSVRRGILEWISTAKKAETRQRRVTETATLAGRNERANQWRPA